MGASDKSVKVVISADSTGFVAAVKKAHASSKELATELGKASQTDSWRTLSTSLGTVGLALTAVAGLAVRAWADFDAEMSKVSATGQDAKGSLDALRAAALQAGADTKYSATDAAQGIEALLKAGVSSKDVLAGGLTGALNLAASGNLSVADSAEVAATAMTQFGLSGKSTGHIADLLAAGAGKAQGEVSDMGAALKQSGLVASQAGLSLEETTGTLAAFASAGLIGSDAGTSLRTMLLRLMNPTKEASDLMAQYGISAYDASGNFVTMADLAGQLQSKMGGLTAEQRNSTLATIFGSDAIRGANVLYSQGAEGISKWTAAVDDQGYASIVAGEKMDNLKGDIETLKGSLDTLLISGGDATGGALRTLAQNLTAIVNAASANPEAAQAIIALVAALGGIALVSAGVMKAVTTFTAFRASLAEFSAASPRAAAGVNSLGKAAGTAAAALAIASVAAHALSNNAEMPGVFAGVTALESLATSADNTSSSMDEMFKDRSGGWGSTDMVAGVNSLDTALKRLNASPVIDGIFGIGSALLGTKSELSYVTDQFDVLDKSIAKVDPSVARAAFSKIAESADNQGMSLEKLISLFPEYHERLQATAQSLGVTTLSTQDYVDWMGGKIPAAIQEASEAAKAGSDSSGELSDSLTAQQLAAQAAAKEQQNLAEQITAASDAALAASGSAISYEAAIDAASEAVAKNGQTLDIGTEAGRNNRSALDEIASSALNMASANASANASQDTINANLAAGREQFILAAQAMGATSGEAINLADKYGLIPGAVVTSVSAPGAIQARDDTASLSAMISGLPKDTQAFIRAIYENSGVNAARAALDSLHDKTITVTTINRAIVAESGRYAAQVAMADGGYISGPGTGRSDSILSWVSNGEYVVNAAATAKYRSLLDAVNSGASIPGFAGGGYVDRSTPAGGATMVSVSAGSARIDPVDMARLARAVAQEAAATSRAVVGGAAWASANQRRATGRAH